MRIDCQIYGHWKDLLICAMSCPQTHRCKQFKEWRSNESKSKHLWQHVLAYIQEHPKHSYKLTFTPTTQSRKKEKSKMKQYVCIREEQILVLTEEEIRDHLFKGVMFEDIYELGRGMELQIRLVPAKKTNVNKDDNGKEEDAEEGRSKRSRSKK